MPVNLEDPILTHYKLLFDFRNQLMFGLEEKTALKGLCARLLHIYRAPFETAYCHSLVACANSFFFYRSLKH